MTNRRPHAFTIAAILSLAGLTGCTHWFSGYYPGGGYVSRDRFVYESTSWTPQTITLRDTRTGEDIWSLDVPVGQKLVVWFHRGEGPGDAYPDSMTWDVMDFEENFRTLRYEIAVPPDSSRLIVSTLRTAPELPGAVTLDDEFAQPAPAPPSMMDGAPPPSDDEPEEMTPEPAPEQEGEGPRLIRREGNR